MLPLTAKIFVAGAYGLVGSHLVQLLRDWGYTNLLTPRHSELDLTDPVAVKWYFSVHEPEYVYLCAAKVGGIKANVDQPIAFLLQNLAIQNNVITNAADYGVRKLLFLGSSCVYPRDCPQPIKEEYLLTGPFEPAVEAYGIAKVAGIKLCQYYHDRGHDFVSAMPCNLFGPRDNFSDDTSHVLPGLMARMHRARLQQQDLVVWGDPQTRREFLYAPDLADALFTIMEKYHEREPINVGSAVEMPIIELVNCLRGVVDYRGPVIWDSSKVVGTPRKVMDSTKLRRLGWYPKTLFEHALRHTYRWFVLQ